jgi:hypothetical protein
MEEETMDAQEKKEIDKRIRKKMRAIDTVAKTIKGVKAMPTKTLIVFIKLLALCKEYGIDPYAPSKTGEGTQAVGKK